MTNVLEPLPGGTSWRVAAARALGWLAVARLVSPIAGDVFGSLSYLAMPLIEADPSMWIRGVSTGLLLVWGLGVGVLVWGTVQLARAMRDAPRPGPLFELGPGVVILTVALLALLVAVSRFFPDNAAFGLSRAFLAPIPPILVLLLAAATFARAGEAGLQLAARVLVVVPFGEGLLSAAAALTNRSLSADSAMIALLSAARTGWVILGEGAMVGVLVWGAWRVRGEAE